MSLTTMTSGRSLSTAMLLIASQAIPPVRAPSPMTATVWRPLSPRRRRPLAMPSAQDRAVEAWEFSTTSCSDSVRLGYPDRPPCFLSLLKSCRPVSTLCT